MMKALRKLLRWWRANQNPRITAAQVAYKARHRK
jgi:hypothetical protein